jgi:UDP-glucose 4-epimerase
VVGLGHGAWTREQWRSWGIDDWHAADVTLEALVTYAREPAVIVHCAGSGVVSFSVSHPYQDYQRNVATTAAALEYVRLYAPSARVVIASSAAVYGLAQRLPIGESDPIQPVSPYGVHKRMAEELCLSYSRQFGLSTAIVRLFSIYGPGLRKQLLWDACTRLQRGDTVFAGTGAEVRDWLHVEDAAALLLAAGQAVSDACLVVNGGTGQGVRVDEIVEHLRSGFGVAAALRFTGQRRAGDPPALVADIRAARELGWSARVDWRAGVSEYMKWFQEDARC